MGGATLIPETFGNWKAEQVTSSGSYTVSSKLQGGILFVTAQASGGGGAGGQAQNVSTTASNNDYGCGGAGGAGCFRIPLAVTAGESLTVALGSPGTGGAGATSVAQTGSVYGSDGADGSDLTLTRSGTQIFILKAGKGGLGSVTGGRGVATEYKAAAGVTWGGDGGDDTVIQENVGTHAAITEGADAGTGGQLAYGGRAGGSSLSGKGGNGGDAAKSTDADTTASPGTDGQDGAGGGGGGGALSVQNTVARTVTGGDGGDGGGPLLWFEWVELR